ncbi:hypothetical protein PHLCEN_2v10295 [Hermanssonia centrifuga]|uniref:NAD(P)-binding domain-containing protein n=1 Tax=Hermanssonia centrifuga TaxID=98765 RepID=A0A2R6NNA2_9APHY|nr:hypothetical protein PHLCEN_2v10295 [Hermanssonia centrifuga]
MSLNVYAIGASRNIGYYTALRLLEKGATVTFLLRSPTVFNEDAVIQSYVQAGTARLVKGDALNAEDVAQGWEKAIESSQHVDLVLFTVGECGTPTLTLTKGAVLTTADLCTHAILNVLRTIPPSHRAASSQPKIIAISSTGLTPSSHAHHPLPIRALYSWLLPQIHADKLGLERVLAYCAGWEWKAEDGEPREDILPAGWTGQPGTPEQGELKQVLVVRPAMLTDGGCKADKKAGRAYRVGEEDLKNNGYTVSRRDVAHFIVEGALPDWTRWGGKRMSIAY